MGKNKHAASARKIAKAKGLPSPTEEVLLVAEQLAGDRFVERIDLMVAVECSIAPYLPVRASDSIAAMGRGLTKLIAAATEGDPERANKLLEATTNYAFSELEGYLARARAIRESLAPEERARRAEIGKELDLKRMGELVARERRERRG